MYQPYMVAMSHLSDAQELIGFGYEEATIEANRKINFAKWLISSYRDDMVTEIDPEAEFARFEERF